MFSARSRLPTLETARRVVSAASAAGKALPIGDILRVHPSWSRFVEIGWTLGKPLATRPGLIIEIKAVAAAKN
jgi:hypothetical protein